MRLLCSIDLSLGLNYKIDTMEFKELVSHYQIQILSEEGIAYCKIDSDDYLKGDTPVIEAHSILFVIDGELKISVQGEKYILTRGCFADVMDGRQTLKLLSASKEVHAILIILTETYLYDLFKHKPPFTPSYVSRIRQNPVSIIDENRISSILHCLDDIEQTLTNLSHHFRDTMLKCKIWILFMEIAEIFLEEKCTSETFLETDRQKALFAQFLKQMSEHIEKEHTVNFYASLLSVTPQYLRRVVKNCSGKIASQWINEELIRKICNLLLETDISIQEIAEKLNFSDQAVLTKFFKRYKGVSPLQFRNNSE